MFGLFKRSKNSSNVSILEALNVGMETASGQHVNAQTAQSLPAVYCAVSTLAESVASLPIHIYLKNGNGDRERQDNHYIDRLLNHQPNEYQTAYDFKIALMRSVLLRGNGYALIDFDGSGKPTYLHWLHPDSVVIKKLINGRIGYQITSDSGKVSNVLQEQLLHVKYHSDDGIFGKSPIQVCRESVGLGLAQQEHGASLLKNGVRPSGVLTTDSVFNDVQRGSELLNQWNSIYSGTGKAGKTALLENGLKWQSIGLTNVDAEWLQSRNFTVIDVSRMFKLSPVFLMDYSNSTFNNHSESQRYFLTQTLRPWLTNLQQALSDKLITSRNQYRLVIEFETKDLLRGSTAERYDVYDAAIRNGIMSPNECRKLENMSPREGGDDYSQSWIQKGQPSFDGDNGTGDGRNE